MPCLTLYLAYFNGKWHLLLVFSPSILSIFHILLRSSLARHLKKTPDTAKLFILWNEMCEISAKIWPRNSLKTDILFVGKNEKILAKSWFFAFKPLSYCIIWSIIGSGKSFFVACKCQWKSCEYFLLKTFLFGIFSAVKCSFDPSVLWE